MSILSKLIPTKLDVFKKSRNAEIKTGLRKTDYLHNLQRLADQLCERHSVPSVVVVVNEDLQKREKNGWFKPPNTLEISREKAAKGTIIHEFTHYLDWLRRKKAGIHDRKFKQLHLQVLRNYLRGR